MKKPLDFSAFNEHFFTTGGMMDIVWFGKKGVIKYKTGLVVEIILSTHGTHEQYEGYRVKILKNKLEPTGHYFNFNDYFPYVDDIDSNGVRIIDYCCENGVVKFYGHTKPKTEDVVDMVNHIHKYIIMYEDL